MALLDGRAGVGAGKVTECTPGPRMAGAHNHTSVTGEGCCFPWEAPLKDKRSRLLLCKRNVREAPVP